MAAESCSACQALAQLALLSGEITITSDLHTKMTRCFWGVPLVHRATSSRLELQMMFFMKFNLFNRMLGLYCRVCMQCEVAEL